jgi:hypothetical protein
METVSLPEHMPPSGSASGSPCPVKATARAWNDCNAGIDGKIAELDAKKAELDAEREANAQTFDKVLLPFWKVRKTPEFKRAHKSWANFERSLTGLITKDKQGWKKYVADTRQRMKVSCTPLPPQHC